MPCCPATETWKKICVEERAKIPVVSYRTTKCVKYKVHATKCKWGGGGSSVCMALAERWRVLGLSPSCRQKVGEVYLIQGHEWCETSGHTGVSWNVCAEFRYVDDVAGHFDGHGGDNEIPWAFQLFISPPTERIMLEMTNSEGRRVFEEKWKPLNQTDLHACIGVWLAEVDRSKGEASLWNEENGTPILSLETFHMIARVICFDSCDTRNGWRERDQLSCNQRCVWEKYVERKETGMRRRMNWLGRTTEGFN